MSHKLTPRRSGGYQNSMILIHMDVIGPWKVVTYSVSTELQDKQGCPCETYLLCGAGKDFDSCTTHHRGYSDAKRYHESLVQTLRGCHNEA